MQFLEREILKKIKKALKPNKVLLLFGARRTGKTEILKKILKHTQDKYLLLNGDDFSTHELLENATIENYKIIFSKIKLLAIDEAQKIPEIGKKLKLAVDNIEGLKIIATGSSVFDLSNKLGEPLTGRKISFILFPFAQMEYSKYENIIETKNRLDLRLIYGNYPELINYKDKNDKALYLKEILNSYLLKDILEYDGIKNSDKILDLLRLIAYQLGAEVSLNELSNKLGIHKDTVARYLDLLSKLFVIFKIQGFSRNLRKEVTKMSRWYFYDNGIRNVLINNLNDLKYRNDIGMLWENYIISERVKYQNYNQMLVSNYFWRTYQQQEIDWIEDREGKLFAYEFKWNPKKKVKIPSAWKDNYKESEFKVINPDNYLQWIE